MRYSCFVCLALTLSAVSKTPAGSIRFRDAGESAGIHFVHSDGGAGRRHIVETVASGLGWIDYNGDDLLDLYLLNGARLPGTPPPDEPLVNRLYRNNGDETFTDVTEQSGAGDGGYGLGCAVADYDNDGHEDLFITNYGGRRMLRNRGDGTFEDVTERAGLASSPDERNDAGAGAAFLDFDRDGRLDLFVGNYLEFDVDASEPCAFANTPVYCDPRRFPPVADRLFRNVGDGVFTDVSESTGIGRRKGYAMGVVCSDFDLDGWTDIFVGNDVHENFLFRNRRDGTFEEMGLLAGVAYDEFGDPQGTMGVNAADYDGDGRFDIFLTDYQNQANTLYRNSGDLWFTDVTVETGAGAGSLPLVTWGGGFADFDNDGVRELFAAAGHLQDNVERYDQTTDYKQRNLLFEWRAGRFVNVTAEGGGGLEPVESSRGAIFGDLNNDGRIDIVVQNARARPTIMINETETSNHWALLKLRGVRSNRSAVGAVVRVTADGRTQVDEVRAGRGYQSAEDLRLHFGLGASRMIDRVEVRWPNGATNIWEDLEADRVISLIEGEEGP